MSALKRQWENAISGEQKGQCFKKEMLSASATTTISVERMLHAKIASAMTKIITNPHLKKKVSLEKQQAQMQDRFHSGRQIAYMIYELLSITGAHDVVLDYTDLFSVALHGDDIQGFDTRWDQVLVSTSEVPNDKILDS